MLPVDLLKPLRKIEGYSAILLPFTKTGSVDWTGFEEHVSRTLNAGLVPAVNMDTGYTHLIDTPLKMEILERTRAICAGKAYVAGAFVADRPDSSFDEQAYRSQMQLIESLSGIPVLFQSYGLTNGSEGEILKRYQKLSAYSQKFIGFELGTMFAPFGKIYSLELYGDLMQIPECLGAKHSSLSREREWDRLRLRNRTRPEFRVFTGNDLAIDMVMYGSDYLLGLSTFAPDLFALRDRFWEQGDEQFYELNDVLQYLGYLTFRVPVPAYKHSAAQFLKLRDWIETDETHLNSPRRPESDRPLLQEILDRLEKWSQ